MQERMLQISYREVVMTAGTYGQQIGIYFLTTFQKIPKSQKLFNYFLNVVLTIIYLWSYAQSNELMLFSN